ncbi:hypothetical protein U0C82_09885 [Fulvimarina sp. 2208YS6-2-32]|uniref:AraC family transcriptional regulator n=1 Tax=Fulvimarina uroteuthidis TaxID=3098149 RepID=A0ABU5I3V4_9HYPH|nr:hypothetical protein [Fulvimarina sp. 2208YS6-2-32]MDY8109448.1 hypothetical protein [Fulvimarina sp. 2208YS6-2-32]
MSTHLYFVSMNTGVVERMAMPEAKNVEPAALDLRQAFWSGAASIAAHPGYSIKVSASGLGLISTIHQDAGDQPLATLGVLNVHGDSLELWQILHDHSEGYDLATARDVPPPAPWCAVRMEPALFEADGATLDWLPAYELCLATAWILKKHNPT